MLNCISPCSGQVTYSSKNTGRSVSVVYPNAGCKKNGHKSENKRMNTKEHKIKTADEIMKRTKHAEIKTCATNVQDKDTKIKQIM